MLRRLQEEQKGWVAHNFGERPSWWPLLGVMEELGELAHAHLKGVQGIRTGENHEAAAKDAVADIVIFLADYCTAEGIDFEEVVRETWEQVKKRDWRADPVSGGTENGQ
jgi:NTP pyrophosphatase (non-canonical NTP hydrolase)